jgi:threonyl-tRNA synthetase
MSSSTLPTVRSRLAAAGKLAADTVAAYALRPGKLGPDKQLVDLHSPVPADTTDLLPIAAGSPEALPVIRHSSAHLMADAVQRLFPGTKVAFGPATDNGFYYDYDRPGGQFSDDDLRAIEARMAEIAATDAPFVREIVAPEHARELLRRMGETYKLEHLERLVAAGETISIYRHGNWVDLCEGPHVPSTRFLQVFQLTGVAGAYWRGDERNPQLQRIHGTAFADQKALQDHLKQLEEAKQRDHRKLGKELGLVAFHPWAPASPFFLPRGAFVYKQLVDYMRHWYEVQHYVEVVTPQIFDRKLFETSGHLPAYVPNMFFASTADDVAAMGEVLAKQTDHSAAHFSKVVQDQLHWGVKPMNCPGHCLVFGFDLKSYRDLPLRMADFGRLHRYERSGVTAGLTRVRTFAQDDAHIFCAMEQVQGEIEQFIKLVYAVYQDFGFTEVRVVIATRPDQRLGSDEVWDKAESALVQGVSAAGLSYEIAPGEGAFYGPKIEFHLKDALGRSWQLGTMQVDFNLPERFDLSYVAANNERQRPVMLHRAVLGSIERFLGVLIEHCSGSFPTWIAPEQIALLTVHERFADYANEVAKEFRQHGLRVTVDTSNEKLGAKIRAARNLRVPYLAVIGEREMAARALGVRSRDENKELGALPVADVLARLLREHVPQSRR